MCCCHCIPEVLICCAFVFICLKVFSNCPSDFFLIHCWKLQLYFKTLACLGEESKPLFRHLLGLLYFVPLVIGWEQNCVMIIVMCWFQLVNNQCYGWTVWALWLLLWLQDTFTKLWKIEVDYSQVLKSTWYTWSHTVWDRVRAWGSAFSEVEGEALGFQGLALYWWILKRRMGI